MPKIIQVVSATGQSVYIFIYNSLGQIWNGSSFVTFSVASWASYAIATVEQTSSGSYIAQMPVGITTPGDYTYIAYIELNAPTPTAGDTPVSQGPFNIPVASSIPVVPDSLAGLILSLRILVQDYLDSKIVEGETLGGSDTPMFPVDGVNQTFRLKKKPLSDVIGDPTYVWVTIVGTGAVVRTQIGFTIADPQNGIIHFSVAPNPGTATPAAGVYVDYNYVWFNDIKYAQFIYQAAQMTLAGTTDPTTIPSGLNDAMMQFAISQFWKARASQYAEQYKSSGGEASQEVQTVAQTYLNLGKDAFSAGLKLQTAYYQGQGQRESPGYGNFRTYPPPRFDPITPRH